MNEKEMRRLMRNLSDDLVDKELDAMTDPMDIDVDSILSKAQAKLDKEEKKMKKWKWIPIAAAVCLMAGATGAYASDLPGFLQAFFGKTTVYSAVVDGASYYLEDPMELDGGGRLYSAMSAGDRLDLVLSTGDGEFPVVKVKVNGGERDPGGFSKGPNGFELSFYETGLVERFDLLLGGKSYPVALAKGIAVTEGGEIIPAEPNGIDWISVGYRPIDGGVQIFTGFTDDRIQLVSIGEPEEPTVESSFRNEPGGSFSNTTNAYPYPLVGTDSQGRTYDYSFDANDVGRPLTKFTSNAPAGEEISLKIPTLVVSYDASHTVDVALPPLGEETTLNADLDLGLQTLRVKSIRRTSATTAVLQLEATGGGGATLRTANVESGDLDSGEMVWEQGACSLEVSFQEDLEAFHLLIGSPYYEVNGDWILLVK